VTSCNVSDGSDDVPAEWLVGSEADDLSAAARAPWPARAASMVATTMMCDFIDIGAVLRSFVNIQGNIRLLEWSATRCLGPYDASQRPFSVRVLSWSNFMHDSVCHLTSLQCRFLLGGI
jgi:hypothetical protein